jgi:hypothetical protein
MSTAQKEVGEFMGWFGALGERSERLLSRNLSKIVGNLAGNRVKLFSGLG